MSKFQKTKNQKQEKPINEKFVYRGYKFLSNIWHQLLLKGIRSVLPTES